jgi:hypothetical protein
LILWVYVEGYCLYGEYWFVLIEIDNH